MTEQARKLKEAKEQEYHCENCEVYLDFPEAILMTKTGIPVVACVECCVAYQELMEAQIKLSRIFEIQVTQELEVTN